MNLAELYSDIKSGVKKLTEENLIQLIEGCKVIHPDYRYEFKSPTLCILDNDVQLINVRDLDKSFNLIKVIHPVIKKSPLVYSIFDFGFNLNSYNYANCNIQIQ